MTDLRPYFMQIIGHNTVTVHRIPSKLGTELHLNEPCKCAKFQPYWSMHSCFMVAFAGGDYSTERNGTERWTKPRNGTLSKIEACNLPLLKLPL